MKKLLLILFLLPSSIVLYSQEICNNALDDDGDTFIDLNDDECDCEGFGVVIESLIPNPSFEDTLCCPLGPAELFCAENWHQASDLGTSDYFHQCYVAIPPEMLPLPGEPGGAGFAGFIVWGPTYVEYIGTEHLLEPLLAGTSYTLNLYLSVLYAEIPNVELAIFGTPDIDDMPWVASSCPIGIGSWELLTSQIVAYPIDGSWQEISFTFTPTVNMNAIALGSTCETLDADAYGYYNIDELTLNTSESFSDFLEISESGSWCDNDLLLTASTDTTGGSWQWYKDGIALLDETDATLNAFDYGEGNYSAIYFLGVDCIRSNYLLIDNEEGIPLELIYEEPTCFGFSDGSVTVNVFEGGDELIYEITNAEGEILNESNSNTANELGSGWYYINVESTYCSGLDSIFLDQPGQLAVDLTTFDVLCNGLETGWAMVDSVFNFTGDYNQISYFWNPNPAGVNGLGADSTWGLDAGNYILTINDQNGCSRVVDFQITEPSPLLITADTRPALCRTFGYQNGNGVVFGDVTGGVPDYTYLWTDLTTGETTPNTTWGGRNPGNYELTVTDANGCVVNTTVFLDSINPQAIFSVSSAQLNADYQGTAPVEVEFINESINFAQADDPLSDTTFFWNLDHPSASWYLTHNYFEIIDTTYQARGQSYQVEVCLIALNKNNCSDTACKILTIYEPIKFSDVNIFSPNGDGINDVFTFEFKAASIAEFECVIVNRWGVVITELTSITDGWDGTTNNGALVEDGVYFYSYNARTDNNTLLVGQGNIQVIGGK